MQSHAIPADSVPFGLPRDLLGYRGQPPHAQWPGGARLAVSLVLNFEEGAEYAISEGDSHNEAVYEVIDRLPDIPDPCLQSHFDYGTRAGWWRIMQVMQDFGTPCTVSACGAAIARLPELARDAIKRGHEISAHGWRWESHARMGIEEELRNIRRTVQAIEQATGQRPLGWHTRSASSPHTRALLMQEGFVYDSDFYGDDLPIMTRTPQGTPYVVLPYAFDTNDMQFQHTQRFSTAHEFADYVIAAIDWLWHEGAEHPKMLSIGLHLRMLGRPARIAALQRILEHIQNKGQIWVARRDAIAKHWSTQCCK